MRGARMVGAVLAAWLSLAGGALARPAASVTVHHWPASHGPALRIGRALGIMPLREVLGTPREPVVFHGGTVMHGVHVHAVFWAPAGYAFPGPPQSGVQGYEALLESFFADAAHDAGRQDNVFASLTQYGDGAGPGTYALSYSPDADTVADTDPYPSLSAQCASPAGVAACLTDGQIQTELRHVIAGHGSAAGLHDVWFMFLPPAVDECVSPGQCGTTAFAGYHSVYASAHGAVVYAVVIDPMIEQVMPPGADPEGNPDAEAAADVAAHEAVEAMTDPEGTGWMDPDGGEVADKCATAYGTPRGFAGDGSPYNQVINGHEYLLQEMWSNKTSGCVQAARPTPAPRLPAVNLVQYSPVVSGDSGEADSRLTVTVGLVRGGSLAALARTTTSPHGGWRVTLRSPLAGTPLGVGDDRDVLLVSYGRHGPAPETIATGDGGDPFTEAGFTSWYALDHGFAVHRQSVALSPCGQTGILTVRAGVRDASANPMDLCSSSDDVAIVPTGRLTAATPLRVSSADNRASTPDDPAGVLVRMTVAPGEPGSISDRATKPNPTLSDPSGLPACTADLATGRASCDGLVPHGVYALVRRGHGTAAQRRVGRAGSGGIARFGAFGGGITGGDTLTLTRRGGRTLTTLHVAHLRVALSGNRTSVSSGVCEPGEYWGAPLGTPPTGARAISGTGSGCPLFGVAAGLPARLIAQIDSRSGGMTEATVPTLAGTSPAAGAPLYGSFIAVARAAGPGAGRARVSLVVVRHGGHAPVRRVEAVGAPQGARVPGLPAGVYDAVWTIRDANGDTRTVRTWFVEEG